MFHYGSTCFIITLQLVGLSHGMFQYINININILIYIPIYTHLDLNIFQYLNHVCLKLGKSFV